MNTLNKILILTAAAMTAVSCANEIEESSESVQDRILKAFVEKYYPEAQQTASGLYIICSEEGSGRYAQDTSYVRVDYAITYLNGTYSSYTSDSIAKQLGTFTYSGYYEPRIWSLRESTPGVVELLTGMREGGSVKAIVPATLLDEESGMEITEGDGSSKIYEITLHDVIDNIDQYQFDQLADFAATHYPAAKDSTSYGFYYVTVIDNSKEIPDINSQLNIRYVGKYLNGTVFDTNIEDTAKKYRIHNSSAEYAALTYTYKNDSSETVNENDFVIGFNKALYGMNYGERAVTFFYSDLGYGDDGSGNIPGFTPLFFELWVEEAEDEDE